jgi:menaquinone-dependent protoporphyrinogen oxidase
MSKSVLVAYASKYGGTAGIAEKIGQVLTAAGLQVEVLPASGIRDLSAYEAVVLGSGVYIGSWRKEAVKFLEANEKALAERPVWLFSSGPTGEGDPVKLTEGWRFPKGQQPIADRIHPRDIALFHGTIMVEKMNPIERWMLKNVKAGIGDFRDWEAIGAWAESIAAGLQ